MIIEVENVGQVEVDNSFVDMSEADQQNALQYITKQYSDGITTNMENGGGRDGEDASLGDYATATAAAIGRGLADTVALPANLVEAGVSGYENVFGENYNTAAIKRGIDSLPDTRDMLKTIPIADEYLDYKVDSGLGDVISTAGEFAGGGGLIGGVGKFAAKSALKGIGSGTLAGAVSGVGSEAAGKLTEGTDAETYARIAGAFAAPMGLNALARSGNATTRAFTKKAMEGGTSKDLKPAIDNAYNQLKTAGIKLPINSGSADTMDLNGLLSNFKKAAKNRFANTEKYGADIFTRQSINQLKGIIDAARIPAIPSVAARPARAAPPTTAREKLQILYGNAEPKKGFAGSPAVAGRAEGGSIDYVKLEELRKTLNENYRRSKGLQDSGELAILDMIDEIDDFILKVPPQTSVSSGEVINVKNVITEARSLHRTKLKMQAIEEGLDKAERAAQASGSGANIANKYKQAINRILNNERRFKLFEPEEIAAMRKFVAMDDGTLQTALRSFGKLSPLSGPLGATIGIGSALYNPASLAISGGASIAKIAADRRVGKRVQELKDLVASGRVPMTPRSGPIPINRLGNQSAIAGLLSGNNAATEEEERTGSR